MTDKLEAVAQHLKKQTSVKHVHIVSINGKQYVKADLSDRLHNGTNYTRTCYYDENGTHVIP